MTFYFSGALFTGGLLLKAFLKDGSTPKTDVTSWLVLIIATGFWFIALPCILRKRTMQTREANPTKSLVQPT